MTESSHPLPLRHLSIRVPWHDLGWNGRVCEKPCLNGSCLILPRIAESRDEDAEDAVAGRSIGEIDEKEWPCCVPERAMFMAPFEYVRHANHPYVKTSPETHGHFASTPLRHPPYSAPALPFRWMFNESMEEFRDEYEIDVDPEREPELAFRTAWVQERGNQKALLDCFFGHVKPEESLCFFYAKQVPFVEDSRRVIVGVGLVKHVGEAIEYKYREEGELRSILWERMIQHSIRPEFKDGFILPYHAVVAHLETHPDLDPIPMTAFAPEDRWVEFSYATEHVSHDGAIAALLACAAALTETEKALSGGWERQIKWLHQRLGELWRMRGPCPGLGAALCAFGIEYGTFVAREIEMQLEDNEDPWPRVADVFEAPERHLSVEAARKIGKTLRAKWCSLPDERRALLHLVSRFSITPEQAKVVYVPEERESRGMPQSDEDIIKNPYLIYEMTRLSNDPVSVWTIDRGVFPDEVVRNKHPLSEPSALDAGTDARRIRALTVYALESVAGQGHSLLPQKDVVLKLRSLDIQPACEVDTDLMKVAESEFSGAVDQTSLADGDPAYQLARLKAVGNVIRRVVTRRSMGKRLVVDEDWRALLDRHLGGPAPESDEQEQRAREEKTAALKELAESRLSVLIGPAGTGKTTLLAALCSQKDVAAGEVLLLAPTGKARVRMEQQAQEGNLKLKGYTIAQFLSRCDRYDGSTGRYHLSERSPEACPRTVIIDEASMLTEEMLAAVLDAIKGVHRLILIGDPRQLPPIGTGRPFVDLVKELMPEGVLQRFPRVGKDYAELTVRRRQAGSVRDDLRLADWFSGASISPGEDDVFDTVVKAERSPNVRFVKWDTPEEFQEKLLQVLAEELKLTGTGDQEGFDRSLGAKIVNGYTYFNHGISHVVEEWQILSPVRRQVHGVSKINHFLHRQFRSDMVDKARKKFRKIPRPMGNEEIVYGDKVINIVNHRRKKVYPQEDAAAYVANGEIGIAVGQFKSRTMRKLPWTLKIEFSSQPGFVYDFTKRDFGDEAEPSLELAYALTVHKAQGSEFSLVILVLPNPCWLLSREMLYTALTRQRSRVVILNQGNRADIKTFASDEYSETAKRLTNLFQAPKPVEVKGKFFEDSLIHRTARGELVRSKSEVIIADRLAALDVDYMYEHALTFEAQTKYPDFTIEDEETGQTFYWEHCGMLHDPGYRVRWERKLQWYKDHDVLPAEGGGGTNGILIVTADSENGAISSQDIEKVIREVVLA